MIVNLKQHEIEAALRQYIAQQGININSKSVTISFTAGRKETGISAELDIEDMELCNESECCKNGIQVPVISGIALAGLINQEIAAAEAELEVIAEPEVKTTSLFG